MLITRKFINKDLKEYLETQIENAESYGYEFIEVKYYQMSQYEMHIRGLNEIKVITRRKPGTSLYTPSGIKLIEDGTLKFFPDKYGNLYAYLVDTPRNREYLYSNLASRKVVVTDKKLEKQLKEEALDKGYSTVEKKLKSKVFENIVDSVKEAEVEDLKAEVEELREALKKKKASRPLAGKKLDKEKREELSEKKTKKEK